jgi:hypothetical protein
MSVTGVRKAMGIAQISHLDVTQSNCNPPNVVNHGSSHQQTQVLYQCLFCSLFYLSYL